MGGKEEFKHYLEAMPKNDYYDLYEKAKKENQIMKYKPDYIKGIIDNVNLYSYLSNQTIYIKMFDQRTEMNEALQQYFLA